MDYMEPAPQIETDRIDMNLECPECGSKGVSTTSTEQIIHYGQGADAAKFKAIVPLRTCEQCGFQFLDKEGQQARHEAVCRHLRVMPPAQIRALRDYLQLSRDEFARLTGLGEATIGRWERGALIQNIANDRYLRLVGSEGNIERLRRWTDDPTPAEPVSAGSRPVFQALVEERVEVLRKEQSLFHLHIRRQEIVQS